MWCLDSVLDRGAMQTDLVHDKARITTKEEEEEDRISNLPDDIIHHILSFLDMKLVVQTSAVSRRWKHVWTTVPYLNLNSRTFRRVHQFTTFVKHALSHRNDGIEVSSLNLTFPGTATEFVIDNIVNYAYSHNVRKLGMTWFSRDRYENKFSRYLFRCQTLKHLILNDHCGKTCIPESAWNFPVLETLHLSNMCLGGPGDKSRNLFFKCVNLKDLTLHRVNMFGLKIFNICAPRLSDLTITDGHAYPKVFNVVAPQLKNMTASVRATIDEVLRSFVFLRLSTQGFDSLEKVNLSLSNSGYNTKELYVPVLISLFQKLRRAKFLILDSEIIETLEPFLDQLSYEPCPFNNLNCVKIGNVSMKQKDSITTIAPRVTKYLLENSPGATFIMDIPPPKRSRKKLVNDIRAKKMAKLEAKIQVQDDDNAGGSNNAK